MLFQLVINRLFGSRNIVAISAQQKARNVWLPVVLICCLALASCDGTQDSQTKESALSLSDIAEQFFAKRALEAQWQSPKTLLGSPYSVYTDEKGLTAHHHEIQRATQNINASEYQSDLDSVGLEELMLADEMAKYFGFLTVMERFPHRFLLADPRYSEMTQFIESYESKPSQKQALAQLVRWLKNQEVGLSQGAKQDIVHSTFSVKSALESLDIVTKLLTNKVVMNAELAELLLLTEQHYSSLIDYQKLSKNQMGLWAMPNGADWYHAQFSFRTQTNQQSESLYKQGMLLPKLALKHSSYGNVEILFVALKQAIAETFNKDVVIFNHCDGQLIKEIDAQAALYLWLSSTCVSEAITKVLNPATDVQDSLAKLRQGENVIPLFLQIALRTQDNAELNQFLEQYKQSMLALATIELGLHKYGWSLSFAEQFLMQRSLLSPKAINMAIYKAIVKPGEVSSSIARYQELSDLVKNETLDAVKEEAQLLVITPASQWSKVVTASLD